MNRATARRQINRALDRAVATAERLARERVDGRGKPLTRRDKQAADLAEKTLEKRRVG